MVSAILGALACSSVAAFVGFFLMPNLVSKSLLQPQEYIKETLLFTTLSLGYVGFTIICIWVLLSSLKLFTYHYTLTWRNLVYTDLAALFCDDNVYQIVALKTRKNDLLSWHSWPATMQFEQQLEWRAAGIRALRRTQRNSELPLRKLSIADNILFLRFLFYPSTLLILCIVFGTLLFGVAWIFFITQYVVAGPKYIAGQAVLIAFIDFMLEEPRLDPASLSPPDDSRKPFWYRSVAPLLLRTNLRTATILAEAPAKRSS